MDYIEMNVDEMKKVKDTWQIHLKIFTRKIKHLSTIDAKENKWELKQLEMCYTFCLDKIKPIISIYTNLINLGENCELDEDYFIKKIKEVQRLHSDLRTEINRKSNRELAKKYNYNTNSTKPNLNI